LQTFQGQPLDNVLQENVVAVRIRMKMMGRKARPFYRVCAVDARRPRDGKVIEELGYYDPMVRETDARAILKGERIDYWMSVGALPTDKAAILIKKYGTNGTHLEQQKAALARLKSKNRSTATAAAPAPAASE
jgi:small subunit ribosomal protein S16